MDKKLKISLLAAPAWCLIAAPAFAQDPPARPTTPVATVTMQVLDEAEDVDDIIQRITLPTEASERGVEASQQGRDTASAARADGREFGQAVAEEARQRGGAEAADEARSQARDRVGDDMARGDLENLPPQAQENIPEQARERIRNRGRRGGGG